MSSDKLTPRAWFEREKNIEHPLRDPTVLVHGGIGLEEGEASPVRLSWAEQADSSQFIPKEALVLEEDYGGFSVNTNFLYANDTARGLDTSRGTVSYGRRGFHRGGRGEWRSHEEDERHHHPNPVPAYPITHHNVSNGEGISTLKYTGGCDMQTQGYATSPTDKANAQRKS
ncbi:hypothetical protein F0562_003328 [Nyssa sinensis]|uniref:Uncharacterized protein n=1 Tax=Nyssa sinensis TaxID=561372 RepID=A0A5J5BV80_9ASTE|nr:hypothetical protein F0562_003328 [Nyssa sinensis]